MTSDTRPLKVAIIGGGPAGLGAATELSKHPYIDWTLYEKKPAISEISNGLTVQRNTWRMLEHMGAAQDVKAEDFFRPVDGHHTQHRNGLTGKLIYQSIPKEAYPPHQEPCRMHRGKLQQALLKQMDQSRVRLGRKLVEITQLESKRIRVTFNDGFVDEVDLLVGADGIRSVVRNFVFPSHRMSYTGASSYRTLVRTSDASNINGLPQAVIFWHGAEGNWLYSCPLGGNDFEITAKIKAKPSDSAVDRYSWGREASVQTMVDTFADFCPPIKHLTALATELQQFDYFAGPRLDSVVGLGAVALVGDASHPLSGAFSAGAGFALEDAFVLGASIDWAVRKGGALGDALELYDDVRSPHYKRLYGVLDVIAQSDRELATLGLPLTEEIDERIRRTWKSEYNWMFITRSTKTLRKLLERETSDVDNRRPRQCHKSKLDYDV